MSTGNDLVARPGRGRRARTLILAIVLAALAPVATAAAPPAQSGSSLTADTAPATPPPATESTVRFFNRDIMTMRSTLLGRSPELRARTAEANIEQVVQRPGTPTVAFENIPQGSLVLLGGQLVAMYTPADLDALNHQTMAQARAEIARNLTQAVQAAERDHAPRQLLNGVLMSLLATVVAALAILVLLWLRRQIESRFQRWIEIRVQTLRQESTRHVVTSLRTFINWFKRLVIWLIALLVLEEWLRFVLGQFGFTQPWSQRMTGWIVDLFAGWGQAIAGAVPGLVAAFVILFLARILANTLSMTFRAVESGRFQLFGIDDQLAEPTRKLLVAVVWLFAVAMAYPYLPGAQTDAFKGLSVLVGLMISLGASSIVAQAAGGFTLLYARTMAVGDLVRIGEVEGQVLQIGLFTTRLRNLMGVEISVPNNVVLGGQLHNYSRNPDGPGLWLETGVTIGYDSPWRQVHRLLLGAAAKTAKIQQTPAPYVLQTALSDFYVEYKLRARILEPFLRPFVLTELHANIQDAFNEAGVQIMSPNYEADPEQPKMVERTHWEGVPSPLAARPPSGD
ncbi:mechanosensitive ion channel [Lysobacter arenosi]|uniref:Small-conductance mechanosensitive channel n=1 Tax=Lysobacter arenosi TaxID=2795387 RepID=A0ABX7RHP6_9GAMM|nr:mechanosensitive ion channel family protein [Lysobacter arenosi]QSX76376.1 mechanosensitive ion channel [Lysobacter arenosi]